MCVSGIVCVCVCVLHNFLYLSHKVAMATHTTNWEGERQDKTGEDSISHLTGQSSSHLSVFEGETFERVVLRPLAL